MQDVASRLQIWRHRGTQPTRARPEAARGVQWEHLDNYLSSLAEKGRNAAAVLPVSQTSSSRTAWNPPRYARMHWWARKHAQFVEPPWHASLRLCFRNGGFLRRRGAVRAKRHHRVEEVRRKGAVRRGRARTTGPHPRADYLLGTFHVDTLPCC